MTIRARAAHLNRARLTLCAFDSGTPPVSLTDPLAGLKVLPQWVLWRLEHYDGEPKPRKIPYDPKTLQRADTTNPATWASFETATTIATVNPAYRIGFVFTLNDPYVFVDLDGCRDPDTGEYNDEATHICTRLFPGVAAEVSQSGTGLHLIMRGDKTQFGNRRNKWGGRFEFYQNNRFIAIAGNDWGGNSDLEQTASLQTFLPVREHDRDNREIETIRDLGWAGPEDDQELLARMFASDDKFSNDRLAELNDRIVRNPSDWLAKIEFDKLSKRVPFAALWNADAKVLNDLYPSPTGQQFDHSAADLALMNKLAFWTGKDHVRMIRLFGMSALGKRDKWLKREYYRNRTASNSNVGCRDIYSGTAAERRERQRKENERIGEQLEFDTTTKLMTLAEMEANLFFAKTGNSGAVANAINREVLSMSVARNSYAASLETVKYKDGRNGQEKEKLVSGLELWLKSTKRMNVDAITWKPEGGPICEPPERPGESAFNVWRGLIKPIFSDLFVSDYQLRDNWLAVWREHLAYLIPIETERTRFEQWLAHILQHPGEKIETGWCFVATQTGIGRNWLSGVLSRVLRGYVLNNAILDTILEGKYNGRMSRKLLMVVDEARAGLRGANSWGLSEKLKTMVNADYREINEKHGLQWVEHNALRWLVFSNNWDALPIEQNDRRWNIIENPTLPQSTSYYDFIYATLRQNELIAAVWAHLSTLPLDGFNVGHRSMENDARKRMLSNLANEVEQALADFRDHWQAQVARFETIKQFVKHRIPNVNDTAIRRNLAKQEMIFCEKRVTKDNVRLVIVRELNEQQIYTDPALYVQFANVEANRLRTNGFLPFTVAVTS